LLSLTKLKEDFVPLFNLRTDVFEIQETEQKSIPLFGQRQKVSTFQKTKTKQTLFPIVPKFAFPTFSISGLTPPPFFPPLFFKKPFKPFKKREKIDFLSKPKKKAKGFNTFVKVKKKFVKQNKRPLHKGAATNLGLFLADRSSVASVKVLPAKSAATGKPQTVNKSLLKKFRKPVRNGKVLKKSPILVERRKFRIDSPGEKKQITLKGLKTLRLKFGRKKRKKAKGGLFI